jgi:Tfp pilus assembly protein PilO
MIWKEKRVLLIALGVLLAANTFFFFTYRVRYQERLDSLNQDLQRAETQLREARTARLTAEARYQSYRKIERDVKLIFDEHWSTQSERLTAMIAEVKRLAVASSLTPAAYNFTQSVAQLAAIDNRRRNQKIGATEVGIAFTVEGTYEQVRRLINLLELSRQFVIMDQLGLAQREGQSLTLNLHLKTLFRDEKPLAANRS